MSDSEADYRAAAAAEQQPVNGPVDDVPVETSRTRWQANASRYVGVGPSSWERFKPAHRPGADTSTLRPDERFPSGAHVTLDDIARRAEVDGLVYVAAGLAAVPPPDCCRVASCVRGTLALATCRGGRRPALWGGPAAAGVSQRTQIITHGALNTIGENSLPETLPRHPEGGRCGIAGGLPVCGTEARPGSAPSRTPACSHPLISHLRILAVSRHGPRLGCLGGTQAAGGRCAPHRPRVCERLGGDAGP